MIYKQKILFIFFLSQLLLGVWNAQKQNWLPSWWIGVSLNQDTQRSFSGNTSCNTGKVESCCKSEWYRYAWIPIGLEAVSSERKWAEFLTHKWIINNHNLAPSRYNLSEQISRKEIMKVIMNMSEKDISLECNEIFSDVDADWWCKYIESALKYEFIVENKNFRPNDSISRVEALKLVFKARNISKAYDTWFWEEDYISTAYYYWYISEKFSDYNKIADRWWIFALAAKTYSDNWE